MTRPKPPLIRARIIRAHSAGCWVAKYPGGRWCLAGADSTCWRDRAGTNRGTGHRWFKVRCNCIPCDGLALVHEGDVMAAVEAAIATPKPRKPKPGADFWAHAEAKAAEVATWPDAMRAGAKGRE